VPVARNHLELLAGGLCVLLESRLAQDDLHPVDAGAGFVCRALPDVAAVAALRRHAGAASSIRSGTLGLRGPMVSHHNFPPGAERAGLPHLAIGPDGTIDTGYACEHDDATETLAVTAPPSRIVNVGGYRLPLRDLQDVVGRIDAAASLAAVPDPLVGQRLLGRAPDRRTMQAALGAVGVNPIVISAFRDGDDPALAAGTHHG
jgi:hypothetical protein